MSRMMMTVLAMAFFSQCCTSGGSENLLTISKPDAVKTFEVRSFGSILWRIEARQSITLSIIRYGEVPSGFVQVIPPGNQRPRPFVAGEEIETETVTNDQTVIHEGHARGSARFEGGVWRSTPHQKH
ncbi:MAG TPA: hypothetical protein VG323_14865 [Thermoanaerobaculia bacterium]|nr:hypothetical protein [Thermoanaerobaculia bacterium]